MFQIVDVEHILNLSRMQLGPPQFSLNGLLREAFWHIMLRFLLLFN